MNDVLTLIAPVVEEDALGQKVPTGEEVHREVFCEVASVSRAEWYQGGTAGLKPELVAVIYLMDYAEETVVEYEGLRYGVYRTYRKGNDKVELYLQRKAGLV